MTCPFTCGTYSLSLVTGFNTDYIMQDGGEENRHFIIGQFSGDPVTSCYESPNIVDLTKSIVHCQDYSHIVKKLRNSLFASGTKKGQHTRHMHKQKLGDYGFNTDNIMQDGGEENRHFIRGQFSGDPVTSCYESPNIVDLTKSIVHCQDYSHIVKKLRNSLFASGIKKGQHTRHHMHNKKNTPVHWSKYSEAMFPS